MVISSRFLSHRIWQRLQSVKVLSKDRRQALSSSVDTSLRKPNHDAENFQRNIADAKSEDQEDLATKYRFVYPEFLPDPNPLHRNSLREKLERIDMVARRTNITIPEFYVGSVMAVTISEPHAPGKVNRFVGICIEREGCGLRASFRLRNVVDGQGVEVLYNMYDPTIRSIQCLRLEKRLDNRLCYLRDAPAEYSTFAFDMEPEVLPEGKPVPLNDIKVPLKPPPYLEKWERQDLKGIKDLVVSERRMKKAITFATPWEKYDLMKIYRSTIPQEEQNEIYGEMLSDLRKLDANRLRRQKQSSPKIGK